MSDGKVATDKKVYRIKFRSTGTIRGETGVVKGFEFRDCYDWC
jgi:hypothetical protein